VSVTSEGPKLSRRYAMERRLAPHVHERWAENFIVELRLVGVDGARIGAALSEVESHCSESRQSAEQSFGDPVEYAQSLRLVAADHSSTYGIRRSLVTILVQVVGMLILSWSFEDWLRGPQLGITTGQLVDASFAALCIAALVRYADLLLRMLVHHPIPSVIFAYLAGAAAFVFPIMLLDEVIWHGSAGWGLAAGTATLAGGVVWAVARLHSYGSEEDPIRSPFEKAGTSLSDNAPESSKRSSTPSLPVLLTYTAMIPVGTGILLATTVMLHQMGAR